MPIYGYRCTACGHEFERLQKMTDPPITECEECAAPVKKILYPVGIAFKGEGFHVNDYKKDSGKSSSKNAATETKSESAESSTTEAKPAEAKPAATTSTTNTSSSS